WRRGDSTLRLLGRVVTPDLPAAMGMVPLLGRAFSADEGTRGSAPVALIGEGLWRREFGSAPDIVGKTLTLGDVPRTVIGVSKPPESEQNIDVWVPHKLESMGTRSPTVVAWLRPGVSLEQANADLRTLSAELVSD